MGIKGLGISGHSWREGFWLRCEDSREGEKGSCRGERMRDLGCGFRSRREDVGLGMQVREIGEDSGFAGEVGMVAGEVG